MKSFHENVIVWFSNLNSFLYYIKISCNLEGSYREIGNFSLERILIGLPNIFNQCISCLYNLMYFSFNLCAK